jgi:hypothetical protein
MSFAQPPLQPIGSTRLASLAIHARPDARLSGLDFGVALCITRTAGCAMVKLARPQDDLAGDGWENVGMAGQRAWNVSVSR